MGFVGTIATGLNIYPDQERVEANSAILTAFP